MSARILIAEDEILIARKLESTLKRLGYTVTAIAVDGVSAVQNAAETQPDLVLMDILMPGEIDGIEASHQIKSRFQIPVVYLTAYSDGETIERAKATEPFGYLVKPFQEQELHTTIQMALAKQEIERQRLANLRQSISMALPHEVNTPLTGILGGTNFLLDEYASLNEAEMLEILGSIRDSATRLNQIHQRFLLHVRLELIAANSAAIADLKLNKTFSTKRLLQDCALQEAEKFQREGDLQFDIQEAPVRISGVFLQRIAEELINNALKFSDPGSSIRITSLLLDGTFTLTVRDRGRGMTREQIMATGAFMQFDRQRYEQQGLGLGLALVKRLVDLHDGKLLIDSTVNDGTSVMVTLPGCR